jgi:hypothetical protein
MVPTKIKMIENLTWQSRMDNTEATLDTRHRTKTQQRHKNTTQTTGKMSNTSSSNLHGFKWQRICSLSLLELLELLTPREHLGSPPDLIGMAAGFSSKTQKHNTDNWKDEQHKHHQTKHILFPQNIKKLRL